MRSVILFLVFAISGAADILFILDSPVRVVPAGAEVSFRGAVTNTGSDAVFVNAHYIRVPSYDFQGEYGPMTDKIFEPGYSYRGWIFGLLVSPNTLPGTYRFSMTIMGGEDMFSYNDLAVQSVQVTVYSTPEPSPGDLSAVPLVGILGFVLLRRVCRDEN